jgi:hypothetical protein
VASNNNHGSSNPHLRNSSVWTVGTKIKNLYLRTDPGRDSAVGIATRYGLDGPGIEFRCRRDVPHRPDRPTQSPIQWVPGLSRG